MWFLLTIVSRNYRFYPLSLAFSLEHGPAMSDARDGKIPCFVLHFSGKSFFFNFIAKAGCEPGF
jgi:hypothetical protein